jgi:catalase
MNTISNAHDQQNPVFKEVLENSLSDQQEHGPHLRQLHAKSHGLVAGKFIVAEDLPEKCKVGVFATPKKEYDIWVRFSNASPAKNNQVPPDNRPDGDARGMAIKLLQVEGNTLPSDDPPTQDFVLLNHPVFFAQNAKTYLTLRKLRLAREQKPPFFLAPFVFLNILILGVKLLPNLKIAKAIASKKTGNPLLVPYWSTTPYKLGDHKIKFAVFPREPETPPSSLPNHPDYLRKAMSTYLQEQKKSATFDFFVQFYVDEQLTPIENAMKEWQEKDAPLIKVATVIIPDQAFDTEARKAEDASLLFTPWHTLPEHEPLGDINLSRKEVYAEGARVRRSQPNPA